MPRLRRESIHVSGHSRRVHILRTQGTKQDGDIRAGGERGVGMLTKKQLKDAARCCDGLCELCSCNKTRMAYQDCIREAAKTALAYMEMLERARKTLQDALQDFYQYVQGGKEICAFCLYDDDCLPGETICGATYKGFKWRGLNEREDL